MALYKVKITEIYRRTIEIEANDSKQAYKSVDEMINKGEIALPCNGGNYEYEGEIEVNEL